MDRTTRHSLVAALVIVAATFVPTLARADIVKCVDPQGKVSYTDRVCPAGTTEQNRTGQSAATPNSPSPAERAPRRYDDATYRSPPASAEPSPPMQSRPRTEARERPSPEEQERMMEAEIARMQERVESKRREAQARCDKGDKKGCEDAVCGRLAQPEAQPRHFRACSDAKGLKSGSGWAQMTALSSNRSDGSGTRRTQVTCLTPEKLEIGEKTIEFHNSVHLYMDPRGGTRHGANRFYADIMGDESWASLEEAAEAVCSTRKK
jgi:hypothetical protein